MSEQERFIERYMSSLVGAKIVHAGAKNEFGEVWPIITVKLDNGTIFQLEISADEEGNGPGFVFGLPMPDMSRR